MSGNVLDLVVASMIAGVLVGWLASRNAGTDRKHARLKDIVVGIIGAFLAGWLLFLGGGEGLYDGITLGVLVVGIMGAAVQLSIVRLFS
jgi:uncharacterized membrane protein YeaQ/YmgE (transglycosylase-associated protein family)